MTSHLLKSDHLTLSHCSPQGKHASTPIATRNVTLRLGDVSSIFGSPIEVSSSEHSDNSDSFLLSPSTRLTPGKRKWNVVDRRDQLTALKPPSSLFSSNSESFLPNESGNYHSDKISNLRHVPKIDSTVSKMFGHSTFSHSLKLKEETRDTILHDEEPNRFYRKSLAAISTALSAIGKSCRSIIQDDSKSKEEVSIEEEEEKNTVLDTKQKQLTLDVAFGVSYVRKDEKDVILTSKQKVIDFCDPQQITTFKKILTPKILSKCIKIGEGSYAEVYKSVNKDGQEIVIKIIPMNINTQDEDEIFTQILPELAVSSSFNQLKDNRKNMSPNFIHFLRAACVRGSFPSKLIQEWIKFDENQGSENENPKKYANKLHFILILENGGIELEKYEFKSAQEAMSIFLQTCYSLAAAECDFQFEHRDLHWSNILIQPTHSTHLNYIVDGKSYQIESSNLLTSVIDFTLSRISKDGYIIYDDLSKYEDLFEGEGDYQFEIYRMMKQYNKNNWKKFCPKTNIFWLHYLLHKLIDVKRYKSRSKFHQTSLNKLKRLKQDILNYDSVQMLIESLEFQALL